MVFCLAIFSSASLAQSLYTINTTTVLHIYKHFCRFNHSAKEIIISPVICVSLYTHRHTHTRTHGERQVHIRTHVRTHSATYIQMHTHTNMEHTSMNLRARHTNMNRQECYSLFHAILEVKIPIHAYVCRMLNTENCTRHFSNFYFFAVFFKFICT